MRWATIIIKGKYLWIQDEKQAQQVHLLRLRWVLFQFGQLLADGLGEQVLPLRGA